MSEENQANGSELKDNVSKVAEVTAEKITPVEDNLIGIDHFAKVQLRVAQILSAEKIEKSEKLLKLKVDVGEQREARQILAGIAKYYQPEELIGRKIVIVANLKPAKLMGQVSEGMLLAASDDKGNLELVSPGSSIAVGSVVR